MNISVLGAGAWGTAVAHLLAQNPAHHVVLWARDSALVHTLKHTHCNARYLPDVALAPNLKFGADLSAALLHCQQAKGLLVIATPVAGLRTICKTLKQQSFKLPIVWLCKGLEAETGLLPHEIVQQVLGSDYPCAALTGPSFALEAARGLPTALVAASQYLDLAQQVAQIFHAGNLRVYASNDLIGAQIGGAVKNVLAIATGIADGLQLGDNARAALMTRGLAEMARFAVALGARADTVYGLSGMGDLMLTAAGALSRNRKVGLLLAQGQSLAEVLRNLGHVAEGVPCAQAVQARALQLKISMPITDAVCQVLFHNLPPKHAVMQLLSRGQTTE